MNKINVFFNMILFEKQVQKIKNITIKKYLLKLLKLRLLIWKFIIVGIIALVVCTSSFVTRNIILNNYPNRVVYNTGVSFSFFKDLSEQAVMILQIIPCVLTFICLLFATNIWFVVGFAGVCFGGLCNIIDRAITIDPVSGKHAVVDYIPFFATVINVPDIFITSFSVVLGLGCIILIVKVARTPDDDHISQQEKNIEPQIKHVDS